MLWQMLVQGQAVEGGDLCLHFCLCFSLGECIYGWLVARVLSWGCELRCFKKHHLI